MRNKFERNDMRIVKQTIGILTLLLILGACKTEPDSMVTKVDEIEHQIEQLEKDLLELESEILNKPEYEKIESRLESQLNEVEKIRDDDLETIDDLRYEVFVLEKTIDGYRIEIFSSSGANSKLKARNYRIQFIDKYDSIPAYVVWEYPNFEVRTGDFRTKLEAEKALALIVNEFPFAFITKDKIKS